jgi:hypothetical protein
MRKVLGVAAALLLIGVIAFASAAQGASAKPTTTTSPTTTTTPQGITGYQIVRHDFQDTVVEQDVRAFAECPAGKKVLGGGGHADLPDQVIQRSEPAGDNAWDLQVHAISMPTAPISVSVFAICATVAA